MIQPKLLLILMILFELAFITAYNRQRKGIHSGLAWINLALLFVFNLLWIYVAALEFGVGSLFIVLPLATISLFFHWIQSGDNKRRSSVYSNLFLLILWVLGLIIATVNISYDSELAINLLFVSLTTILIALMIYWPHDIRKEKEKKAIVLATTKRLSFITLLLMSYIFPYLGYYSVRSFCVWQTQTLAVPIIEAVELYKTENGTYPYHLTELVPIYLDESKFSNGGCSFHNNFEQAPHFLLDNCSEGEYVSLYAVGYPTSAYSFRTKGWNILDFDIHPCSVIDGLSW